MTTLQHNVSLHQSRLDDLAAVYQGPIAAARPVAGLPPARTLHQIAWSMALELAGGDPRRIQRVDGALLVTNRPKGHRFTGSPFQQAG